MKYNTVKQNRKCVGLNNGRVTTEAAMADKHSNGSLLQHKLLNGSCVKPGSELHQKNVQNDGHDTLKSSGEVMVRPIVKSGGDASSDEAPLLVAFFTFLSYGVLLLVGYIKEFFSPPSSKEKNRENYVPLYIGFESFYTRNVYRRIQDCFNRPICSVPGEYIDLIERTSPDNNWTMEMTDKVIRCINVGSYNYLGFAQNKGPCHDDAVTTTKDSGLSIASTRMELGTLDIHVELERLTAEFLGVEAAVTFGMGYATNVLNIPALVGPGCLVLSDEYNHASLILGLRLSGATTKVFRHNDCNDLERRLRRAIVEGHPRTRRPWRKVLIVVEGIYSMEGSICNLPRLIEIKKKYKAYLYMDEAHSIGALGARGRGVADYYGCDPRDVDILMGTFTKSFGAAGGYIAGDKDLISHLRIHSDAGQYACAMAPPVVQQVTTAMRLIMGKDGSTDGLQRIQQLHRNTVYFRRRLTQLGYKAHGHPHSPVVPLITFLVTKITVFVRMLTERGVAAVGVGFPGTKITGARMRFCLSAAHTKEMLDKVLAEIDEVGELTGCKHQKGKVSQEVIEW